MTRRYSGIAIMNKSVRLTIYGSLNISGDIKSRRNHKRRPNLGKSVQFYLRFVALRVARVLAGRVKGELTNQDEIRGQVPWGVRRELVLDSRQFNQPA